MPSKCDIAYGILTTLEVLLSQQNRYLVILPARMGAQRLPDKPLRLLGDIPIISRTYSGVKDLFEHVYVATDSDDVLSVCEEQKIPCIRTGSHHKNGTTRTLEAFLALDIEVDYIINVQGDEAFISNEVVQPLLDVLEEISPEAATLQAPLISESSNSNVYVVTDSKSRALYFSRSPIPASRNGKTQRFQHVGVYAFQPEALKAYCAMSPTPLEQQEMLEQLRWLENGRNWMIATAPNKPLSIDTPEDLIAAEELLASKS
ncbi:MAG TPA: 3-deoxy-manno-octulosonate cytidylyltransferase [Cryomorphaceae bacterium]|nr:3-deoxy-manno-octulosonate cytidylyltransferase [Cryomorphaceae bacterium]|tara:strand:- start:432 stop:1211 length:780 start_codon:yes stop_codon:yes gene_type:complete